MVADTDEIRELKGRISLAHFASSLGKQNGDLFALIATLTDLYLKEGRLIDAAKSERNAGWMYYLRGDAGNAFDHYITSLRYGKDVFEKGAVLWLKYKLADITLRSEDAVELELILADTYAELGYTEDTVDTFCLLGETYMKQKEYGLALQYLTIASELGGTFFTQQERYKVYTEMMECASKMTKN